MDRPLPISLVVFDCDGILLESVDVKTKAFAQTVAEHGAEAVTRLIDYHMAHGGVSRYEKFEWFYREVLGREITQNELQALGGRFKQLAFEGVMNAPMVQGAMDAIEALHGKLPLYVVSGTPHEELNMVLDTRTLTPFFQGIYGSPPDKIELLHRIIKQQSVYPAEILMIGDSTTDLMAAQECGTLFYGRGRQFEKSGWPWSNDLHGLVDHIDAKNIG